MLTGMKLYVAMRFKLMTINNLSSKQFSLSWNFGIKCLNFFYDILCSLTEINKITYGAEIIRKTFVPVLHNEHSAIS